VVGKTGTGEQWGKDPINYFVGWVENQKDPLVVLVMVENGGAFEHGSEVTVAPAARNILEAYYGANKSSSRDSSSSKDSSSSTDSSSQTTNPARTKTRRGQAPRKPTRGPRGRGGYLRGRRLDQRES
jgi:hypothetical protein